MNITIADPIVQNNKLRGKTVGQLIDKTIETKDLSILHEISKCKHVSKVSLGNVTLANGHTMNVITVRINM